MKTLRFCHDAKRRKASTPSNDARPQNGLMTVYDKWAGCSAAGVFSNAVLLFSRVSPYLTKLSAKSGLPNLGGQQPLERAYFDLVRLAVCVDFT